MRSKLFLPLAAALLALAGCDKDPADPIAPPSKARLSVVDVPAVSGDATQTIENLVASYDTLRFGQGTWTVTRTIKLDSNTHIVGLGDTLSVISYENVGYETSSPAFDRSLFEVDHTASNVVLEKMYFKGTASRHQFVIKALGAQNVTLRDSKIRKIALMGSAPRDNDPNTLDETRLNRNLYVLGNTVLEGVCGAQKVDGSGRVECSGDYKNEAVELGYVRGGQVLNNNIKNYSQGVSIWGGNALTHSTFNKDSMWASGFLIEGNVVDQVHGGIVLIKTHTSDVNRNTVTNCSDTCLDAEGAAQVTFHDNTSYYANNYVFSVFAMAGTGRVNFNWNRLRKSSTFRNENGDVQNASGNLVFRTVNDNPSKFQRVAIEIHNNEIVWEGSGYGVVTKEFAGNDPTSPSVNYLAFNNNTLSNVVVNFANTPYDNGIVQMRGNVFDLSTAVNQPVIDVSGNHLAGNTTPASLNDPWDAEVAGNKITSTVTVEGIPAVRVLQNAGIAMESLITGNEIRGFGISIQVISDMDLGTGWVPNDQHHFAITNNTHTGTIDTSLATNVNNSGNTKV